MTQDPRWRSRHPWCIPLALALGLALGIRPTQASSPAAWSAYDAKVRAACTAASRLTQKRVRGERLDLPGPGLSLLVLEGRYPQPHMQGKRGLEMCVFEQSSGKASVVEADRWLTAASGGSR
jgi:hypothetical protein